MEKKETILSVKLSANVKDNFLHWCENHHVTPADTVRQLLENLLTTEGGNPQDVKK